MKKEKIGIVGSGLIGRAWAMLFASVGYPVMLYDSQPEQLTAALQDIEQQLHRFAAKGALRGDGHLSAAEQLRCITTTKDLETVVHKATYIQECIPERVDWKRRLYAELDALLEEQTIIASSTSTFMPSLFSERLRHRENVLVAHPLNPPYFIPLVEIVPAPWTAASAVAKTRSLMLELGQKPVTLTREIRGFAANRLQYAVLNEAWHLVAEGVLSVSEVDLVMTHGLGLRYALQGPLETAHLNANGVRDYFERFGSEIYAVSETYAPPPKMTEATTALREIERQCEELVPAGSLSQRREQRNEFLKQLSDLKKNF